MARFDFDTKKKDENNSFNFIPFPYIPSKIQFLFDLGTTYSHFL
jgi:hypothetical protein